MGTGGISIWQLLIILVIVLIPLSALKLSARSSIKWQGSDCGFRDLSGLVKGIKVVLGIFLITAAVSLWSTWSQMELLDRMTSGVAVSEAEVRASDSWQLALDSLYMVIFLISAILFLRWTYLSNKNARSLNAADMRHSPTWSAAWYFIPILTWWKPYQALKEIFQASHPDYENNWREAPRPKVMPSWWALWLIGTFLATVHWRTTTESERVEDLFFSLWLDIGSHMLDLALVVVLINMVTTLQRWQIRKYQRITVEDGDARGAEN